MSNLLLPPVTKDEIVLEGERYFRTFGGKYHNPYPLNSDEYNRFERGWVQALKRSPTDYSCSRSSNGPEYSILPGRESARLRQSKEQEFIKQKAEEYKARKG